MENPSLDDAMNATVSQQPNVMPTAAILAAEYKAVNTESGNPSEVATGGKLKKDGTPRKAYTKKNGEPVKKAGFVGGVQDVAANAETAQRKELAGQCVNLVEQSGVMIAGNPAKMAEQERLALTLNLDNYLASKNINDIPPGLLLTIGIGMYYGRVLATPDETTKIPVGAKIIFWVKEKIKWRKRNARTNSGIDGKREDDTSKTSGAKV